MKKSLIPIPVGQMFVQLQGTDKPRVWVKIDNEDELSLFVDNDALIGFAIGVVKELDIRDKWYISDGYFEKCVREGEFGLIEDLREAEIICRSRGLEMPESKYLF